MLRIRILTEVAGGGVRKMVAMGSEEDDDVKGGKSAQNVVNGESAEDVEARG